MLLLVLASLGVLVLEDEVYLFALVRRNGMVETQSSIPCWWLRICQGQT